MPTVYERGIAIAAHMEADCEFIRLATQPGDSGIGFTPWSVRAPFIADETAAGQIPGTDEKRALSALPIAGLRRDLGYGWPEPVCRLSFDEAMASPSLLLWGSRQSFI